MGKRISVDRNLNLATLYLADGGPQEWSDALKNDVRGEDRANLTAGGFEVSLNLLDGGFEFVGNKFIRWGSGEERFRRSMNTSYD